MLRIFVMTVPLSAFMVRAEAAGECPAMAGLSPRLHCRPTADEVRAYPFIGHSTFLIESAGR